MDFPAIRALCASTDAYATGPEQDRLFLEAMVESWRFHLERQPFLEHMARQAGVSPDDLRAPDDVYRIPPLFVGTMKTHSFRSVPDSGIAMVLTSSGTAGQRTQTVFDGPSLARLRALAQCCFRATGHASDTPVHYFLLGYDPAHAPEVGTSWSNEQLLALAPALSTRWTIEWDEGTGSFRFDAERWARALLEAAATAPVRLLGFPAFMYQLVEEVRRLRPGCRVDPRSFVIGGGGWKNHQGTPMGHAEFARYVEDGLGVPAANVRDAYGMVEHGVPYNACAEGRHHEPVYGRLRVVDPLTLAPLPEGEEGLLVLYTPYNTAQPNLAVLSTDLAVLGRGCRCGIERPFLASVRRGGIRKHRGCAIAAQEILDRSRR